MLAVSLGDLLEIFTFLYTGPWVCGKKLAVLFLVSRMADPTPHNETWGMGKWKRKREREYSSPCSADLISTDWIIHSVCLRQADRPMSVNCLLLLLFELRCVDVCKCLRVKKPGFLIPFIETTISDFIFCKCFTSGLEDQFKLSCTFQGLRARWKSRISNLITVLEFRAF